MATEQRKRADRLRGQAYSLLHPEKVRKNVHNIGRNFFLPRVCNPAVAARYRLSHRKGQAKDACALMVDGALEGIGDPDSLFRNPGLVEEIVGVPCRRLRRVAERLEER